VCNEPYADQIPEDWHNHIAELIIETEKELPKKHLVSYNYGNDLASISDFPGSYSILNFHYARPGAVIQNRHLQIPIGDNETGFDGTADWPYRTEAWAFMIAGGALFNHLDYSFAVGHEDGDFQYPLSQPGGGNAGLRFQFAFLRQFLEERDFLSLEPETTMVKHLSNKNLLSQASSISDREYLIYLYEEVVDNNENVSIRFKGDFHVPEDGNYTFTTLSDDGVRLWIDNNLLIENWTDHAATIDSASISLKAGNIVPVRLEYYNGRYGGSIRVHWHSKITGETILGTTNTYCPGTGRKGLVAELFRGIRLEEVLRTDTVDFINHSIQEFDFSETEISTQPDLITIDLHAGDFSLKWLDPVNGEKLKKEEIRHEGGHLVLKTPVFEYDVLLVIENKNVNN
ncbi:MAG: hypothetical protein IH594_13660, partial [Bacteroidales bacterium]|nr:hypothetical protein [Bacteroidales bacterium]